MIRLRPPDPGNRRGRNTRRRQNQHLLEVTVRSRRAAELRCRRMVAWGARVLVVVALVAGTAAGCRELLRRLLWENTDFAITEVAVTADGTLSRAEILRVAGVREGENIFAVNLSEARARLTALPRVERVEIRRVLPGCLTVALTERKPVAWLVGGGAGEAPGGEGSFLVDATGILLPPSPSATAEYELPVICGVRTEGLRCGRRVTIAEVQAALQLLVVNQGNPRFDVRAVDLARGYCMEVTDRRRMRVTFGTEGVERQLAKLNRLLEYVENHRREVQTVNLLVEKNIPVQFAPPAGENIEGVPPGGGGAVVVAGGGGGDGEGGQGPGGMVAGAKLPPVPRATATPKPAAKAAAKAVAKATPKKSAAAKKAPAPAPEPEVAARVEPAPPAARPTPSKRVFPLFKPFLKRDG